MPMLIFGDLNLALSHQDKDGGNDVNEIDISFAKDTINNNQGLIDIGYSGNTYTWANGRLGKAHIRQRLNKALANMDWVLLYASKPQPIPSLTS